MLQEELGCRTGYLYRKVLKVDLTPWRHWGNQLISRFKYYSLSIPPVTVAISLSIPIFNESIIGGRWEGRRAESWKIGQELISCSLDSMH